MMLGMRCAAKSFWHSRSMPATIHSNISMELFGTEWNVYPPPPEVVSLIPCTPCPSSFSSSASWRSPTAITSAFVAAKVAALDDSRVTPANRLNDGQNFHPTNKWVLFGHHFAAISGAGPLIGPVLAAQFGYLPGLLWIVIGVCLGGAVQDFLVLAASTRRNGHSLARMAFDEINKTAGLTAIIAIIFILIIALAGLGKVVVKALGGETITSGGIAPRHARLPLGHIHHRLHDPHRSLRRPVHVSRAQRPDRRSLNHRRRSRHRRNSGGGWISQSSIGHYFNLTSTQIVWAMAIYGFIASVLPVWLLLAPRDYLSSFLKIGTILMLVIGVIIANPKFEAKPYNAIFAGAGGGPVVGGRIFPFLFITIMCGAISGFHALVSSGTTSKMIEKESHARMIGYGSMLIEGLVGVLALIAASTLPPGDYYAMNMDIAKAPVFHERLVQIGARIWII